jgi:hypothetical protein
MEGCAEKMNFLKAWYLTTRAHAEAVAHLYSAMVNTSSDYDVLYRVANALGERAVEAEENLKNHEAKHGC